MQFQSHILAGGNDTPCFETQPPLGIQNSVREFPRQIAPAAPALRRMDGCHHGNPVPVLQSNRRQRREPVMCVDNIKRAMLLDQFLRHSI